MIPDSPAAVVIPAPKRRTLVGVQGPAGRTDNQMAVFIDIHNSKVGNEDEERLKVDQISEDVEFLLNTEPTMGGILIYGFVTDWDPGVSNFTNGEYRSVRMTYVGHSRLLLP